MSELRRPSRRATKAARRRAAENGTSLEYERLRHRQTLRAEKATLQERAPSQPALRFRFKVPETVVTRDHGFHRPLLRRLLMPGANPLVGSPWFTLVPDRRLDLAITVVADLYGWDEVYVDGAGAGNRPDLEQAAYSWFVEHEDALLNPLTTHIIDDDIRGHMHYSARRNDVPLDVSDCGQLPDEGMRTREVVIRPIMLAAEDPTLPASGSPAYFDIGLHTTQYRWNSPHGLVLAGTAHTEVDEDRFWVRSDGPRKIEFEEETPEDVRAFIRAWDPGHVVERNLVDLATSEYLHGITGLPPAHGADVPRERVRRARPGRRPNEAVEFAVDIVAPIAPSSDLTPTALRLMPRLRLEVSSGIVPVLTVARSGLPRDIVVTAGLKDVAVQGLERDNTTNWTDEDRDRVKDWLVHCIAVLEDGQHDVHTRMRVLHGWYHGWPASETTGTEDVNGAARIVTASLHVLPLQPTVLPGNFAVEFSSFDTILGLPLPEEMWATGEGGARKLLGTYQHRALDGRILDTWDPEAEPADLSREERAVRRRALGNMARAEELLRYYDALRVSAFVGLV